MLVRKSFVSKGHRHHPGQKKDLLNIGKTFLRMHTTMRTPKLKDSFAEELRQDALNITLTTIQEKADLLYETALAEIQIRDNTERRKRVKVTSIN